MKLTIEQDEFAISGQFKVTIDIKTSISSASTRAVVSAHAGRKSKAIEKNIAEIDRLIEQLNDAKIKLGEA